jgi:hypothetical protein
MPALARVDRRVRARAGRTRGMHAVARSRQKDEEEWPPPAGEVRPSEATDRAVDGRGRILRTAGDVINVGQQKCLSEGDDAAVVRWRQPDAKRRFARAPADDLARLRPLKEVSRELWALGRAVRALQADDDATGGVGKPRGPDATDPRNTTTPRRTAEPRAPDPR